MSKEEQNTETTIETSDDEQAGERSTAVRLAIPLGVAVIIGIFTAIGIEGDALQRVIRNASESVSIILSLAIIGVCLPVLARYLQKDGGPAKVGFAKTLGVVVTVVGSLVLIFAAIYATIAGTAGIAERENPSLKLTLSAQGQVLTLTVDAVAPTLSSDEKMLLRVAAQSDTSSGQATADACRNTAVGSSNSTQVLAYLETGPGRDGNATDSVTVTVPADAEIVCAYALLWDRDKAATDDDRDSWAKLDRSGFPQETSGEDESSVVAS